MLGSILSTGDAVLKDATSQPSGNGKSSERQRSHFRQINTVILDTESDNENTNWVELMGLAGVVLFLSKQSGKSSLSKQYPNGDLGAKKQLWED